jgi:hypothetical protein
VKGSRADLYGDRCLSSDSEDLLDDYGFWKGRDPELKAVGE